MVYQKSNFIAWAAKSVEGEARFEHHSLFCPLTPRNFWAEIFQLLFRMFICCLLTKIGLYKDIISLKQTHTQTHTHNYSWNKHQTTKWVAPGNAHLLPIHFYN